MLRDCPWSMRVAQCWRRICEQMSDRSLGQDQKFVKNLTSVNIIQRSIVTLDNA
jgi:hypothetical protein